MHSDIPDVVSIDITDNNIETQTAHHLDRKKRDADDDKNNDDNDDDDKSEVVDTATDTTASDDDDNDGNDSNVNSKNATNTKRTVRQLARPPPPPHLGPWPPFGDNFDLPPEPRLHGSRGHLQSSHFQRDTELSSVNYNTFLTPPGSGARSTDFYKNDGASAAYYHQVPTSYNKQNEYNPYGNPYGNFKNPNPNTVTEFNTPKPYTVHTTFDISDAQTQRFKPSKLVSQQPFFPFVSNNGTPKPAQSKLPHASAPAEDIDSLPENFSYYHMSNGVQIKQELSHHQQQQHQQQHQPVQQVQKLPQPQSPFYYLDKPTKILSASTPKTHYVHVSTVGGFLNNTAHNAMHPVNNNSHANAVHI